jgi:hypothetical protein
VTVAVPETLFTIALMVIAAYIDGVIGKVNDEFVKVAPTSDAVVTVGVAAPVTKFVVYLHVV